MKARCSSPQNVKLMVLDKGYHDVGYCQRVYKLNKYCFGYRIQKVISTSTRYGKVTGSMLGSGNWWYLMLDARPNRVLTKDAKSCSYCCYVRC